MSVPAGLWPLWMRLQFDNKNDLQYPFFATDSRYKYFTLHMMGSFFLSPSRTLCQSLQFYEVAYIHCW